MTSQKEKNILETREILMIGPTKHTLTPIDIRPQDNSLSSN